jgi:hypothetical protein
MKTNRVTLHEQWLLYMHTILDIPYQFLSTNSFPGNGARNACWHFLTQLLELVFPSNSTRNAVMIFLNTYKNTPQAHGYIVVAFHP